MTRQNAARALQRLHAYAPYAPGTGTSAMVILSNYQISPLLEAREQGRSRALVSLNLGRSQVWVKLADRGIALPDGQFLDWQEAEKIRASPRACFLVSQGKGERIQSFSESLGRVYSLMPTPTAPTLLLSGFSMHRIKDIDPCQHTLKMVREIRPEGGSVLDTNTGLGYTAIEAARTAERVTTLEIDPNVLEMARLNPWSQALFGNPKISQKMGDAADLVGHLEAGTFSCVLHDPPTFKLAGELYSQSFYQELFRLLVPRGRLFHYIGNLRSPSAKRVATGVMDRLRQAGFSGIRTRPASFGLVALRGRR